MVMEAKGDSDRQADAGFHLASGQRRGTRRQPPGRHIKVAQTIVRREEIQPPAISDSESDLFANATDKGANAARGREEDLGRRSFVLMATGILHPVKPPPDKACSGFTS